MGRFHLRPSNPFSWSKRTAEHPTSTQITHTTLPTESVLAPIPHPARVIPIRTPAFLKLPTELVLLILEDLWLVLVTIPSRIIRSQCGPVDLTFALFASFRETATVDLGRKI